MLDGRTIELGKKEGTRKGGNGICHLMREGTLGGEEGNGDLFP